jgi:hypothetical protein
MNRGLAQHTAEEREALDRILVASPGEKARPFESHLTVPGSVLRAADAALREADTTSTWRAVDLRDHLLPDGGGTAPTLLRRSDGLALFYAGKRNEIHGPFESGKTWVALLVVLEVIGRGEVAVWIDFEDSPRAIAARLLALGADEESILTHFRYLQPAETLTQATEIDLRLELNGAEAVFIDAANEAISAAGLDPNVNRDVAAWYATIPRLATQAGAAVVVADHVAKDPERQRGAVGAGHKLAAVNGASYRIDVVTPFGRGTSGLVRLRLEKDRPGYLRGQLGAAKRPTAAEIAFDATNPSKLVVEVKPPAAERGSVGWRPTRLMEQISKFLETQDGPASVRLINKGVHGRAEYKTEALEALVADGFASRSPGPRGANLHLSVRPFRVEQ